jgi:hypothetical protein
MAKESPGISTTVDDRDPERPRLAGVPVREEDLLPTPGIHIAGTIFRIAAVVILLLAGWQAFDWFSDPPPGGAGLSVIIGDTIRMVVIAVLLYGVSDLADLFVRNFEENRLSRILLARQAYMMRQLIVARGDVAPPDADDRRGTHPDEWVRSDEGE